MLIVPQQRPVKNLTWQHWSPNELYENEALSARHLGYSYRHVADIYKRNHKIPGAQRWFEVRIASNKGALDGTFYKKWWDDPFFMDKIFWVYQKPFQVPMDGQHAYCYALEFLEAQRVREVGKARLGYEPFKRKDPCLLIPTEYCHLAWTETSNGYSDHLRHRPEAVVSQKEIDEQGRTREIIESIKKTIRAIAPERMDQVLGKKVMGAEVA